MSVRLDFYDVYRSLKANYELASRGLTTAERAPQIGLGIVERALDAVLKELRYDDRLRPDARLFLVVNVHQMVVLPLLIGPSDVRVQFSGLARQDFPSQLEQAVVRDLRTILVEASLDSVSSHEISAHAVVNATARNWARLEILGFDVWG
jgi:hypothetical protein